VVEPHVALERGIGIDERRVLEVQAGDAHARQGGRRLVRRRRTQRDARPLGLEQLQVDAAPHHERPARADPRAGRLDAIGRPLDHEVGDLGPEPARHDVQRSDAAAGPDGLADLPLGEEAQPLLREPAGQQQAHAEQRAQHEGTEEPAASGSGRRCCFHGS
jgi:hypothetical protein